MQRLSAIIFLGTLAAICAVVWASPVAAQERRAKGIEVSGTATQPGVDVVLEVSALGTSRSVDFITLCEQSDCSDRPLPRSGQRAFLTLCATDTCEDLAPSRRFPVGTSVKVCFEVSAAGYVTLWSIDAHGAPDLIYPNALSHPAKPRAARVAADTRTCVGEDARFRLVVSPPAGTSRLYLHWTPTEEEALGVSDYPVIGNDVGIAPAYASSLVEYEVLNNR